MKRGFSTIQTGIGMIAFAALLFIWLTAFCALPAHALEPPIVQMALRNPSPSWALNGGPYRLAGTPRVFLILGGYKFEIPDHQTFVNLYGVVDAGTEVEALPGLDKIPSGTGLPAGAKLIASQDDPRRTYLLEGNMRHEIGSWPTFFAYNLSETRVTKLTTPEINAIEPGAGVTISPVGNPSAIVHWHADDVPTPSRGKITNDVIESPVSPDLMARGLSAYAHQVDPESWVRGIASLDRISNIVTFNMQLETDSVNAGPKGQMLVTLRDKAGKNLVKIKIGEIGMGGKLPGRAKIKDFHGQATVPHDIAAKVASIGVTVQCTGKTFQLFGIDGDDLIQAIKIVVTIVAAVGSG